VVIPNWLDEIELKSVQVLQPIQVIAAVPEIQADNLNKSLAAEELYLKIRTRLNGLYREKYNNAQYDELIEKLKKLETYL
jgi:hypothetical protein